MTKLMIRHYLTLNVPYPGAMALKIYGSIPDPSDPTMMKQSRGNVNLVMSTAPVAVSMATMGGRSEVSLTSSSGGAGGEEEGSNDDDKHIYCFKYVRVNVSNVIVCSIAKFCSWSGGGFLLLVANKLARTRRKRSSVAFQRLALSPCHGGIHGHCMLCAQHSHRYQSTPSTSG